MCLCSFVNGLSPLYLSRFPFNRYMVFSSLENCKHSTSITTYHQYKTIYAEAEHEVNKWLTAIQTMCTTHTHTHTSIVPIKKNVPSVCHLRDTKLCLCTQAHMKYIAIKQRNIRLLISTFCLSHAIQICTSKMKRDCVDHLAVK